MPQMYLVLKRVQLKSIAVYELVLCSISWHRPKNTPLTFDEHTGQTLVLPLGNSTKMDSDCFLDPVVRIPLGRLLHVFLTDLFLIRVVFRYYNGALLPLAPHTVDNT